ncbi:MAG: DMT family transporter [Candidatus Tectomicrobia bacterium]|nr:DMT family transporter [Candidatus Tectomicrobia bacterium]
MTAEGTAITYGVASGLAWGTGDFSGGLASKRTSVLIVVMLSQGIGALSLLGVALLFGEPIPPGSDLLMGAAAGLSGTLGLAAFYRGLAIHQMGVVAPIAAAVTALVPVGLGVVIEGLPAVTQMIGFGLAILAIWIMSWTGGQIHVQLSVLTLPVAAGLGFAFFLIGIDQASHHAVLWPLVGARVAGIAMLFAVVMTRRQWITPSGSQLPVMALAGLFDATGNVLFALAANAGRLDIAAVLSSLYPATTVLLAAWVLNERLNRQQWSGVLMALGAVVLIAL